MINYHCKPGAVGCGAKSSMLVALTDMGGAKLPPMAVIGGQCAPTAAVLLQGPASVGDPILAATAGRTTTVLLVHKR